MSGGMEKAMRMESAAIPVEAIAGGIVPGGKARGRKKRDETIYRDYKDYGYYLRELMTI